jgi:1-acyl-sn-glycerol-3-phosphate acyltransferase
MKLKEFFKLDFLGYYFLGIICFFPFGILCLLRRIEVRRWKNFPFTSERLIIVSNHPSLWEPVIIPALFGPRYFFRPWRYFIWNTPDKINYHGRWFSFIMNYRSIPVPRGNRRGEYEAFKKMQAVVEKGQIMAIFPEGGRTQKGEADDMIISPKGKRIRKLKNGIGKLVFETKATVAVIAIEGSEKVLPLHTTFPRFWRRTLIKVGQTIKFEDYPLEPPAANKSEKITQYIQKKMLEALDEE